MGHFNWFEYFIPGVKYDVNAHVVVFALVSAVLVLFGVMVGSGVRKAVAKNNVLPHHKLNMTNVFELIGEFLYEKVIDICGSRENARVVFPFACSTFILIFFANILGLIPGMLSSTDSLNTTIALGFCTFIYYNYHGIKAQGLRHYVAHFWGPVFWLGPLMFLIEIISHVLRPLVLALRLRSNIMADHLLLNVFLENYPVLVPVIFYGLGVFVCFIQAFVFTMLTTVYLGMAMAHEEEHGEEAHH